MTVPDFQSLMLPLLKLAADGEDHSTRETTDRLANEFGLTPDERMEMLPSERQRRFDNRVGWAVTYLRQAGLLERIGRGRYRLTERGRQALRDKPSRVDMKYLEQFPEYQEFKSRTKVSDEEVGAGSSGTLTPEMRWEGQPPGSTLARVQSGLDAQHKRRLACVTLPPARRKTD